MKGKALHISGVYSECEQPAVELLWESFLFFLKKELITPDVCPPL